MDIENSVLRVLNIEGVVVVGLGNAMNAMEAARFNVYWYVSIFAPALIMLFATYWRRRSILILSILISLFSTYALCNISVEEKWRVRNEIAQTDAEREYATADGANLVFTLIFIGPFEAILYTSFWGVVGWRLWPRIRPEKTSNITKGKVFPPK